MVACVRAVAAALAMVSVSFAAVAQVVPSGAQLVPPSDQPGRGRERFERPPVPLAQPGGPAISVPGIEAPPGAAETRLVIRQVRIVGATVYTAAQLAELYAYLIGKPVTLQDVYYLAQRITAEAARTLGLEVVNSEIRRPEEIMPAIESLKGRADAIYVQTDPLMNTNRVRISTLALGARLPTLGGVREYVEAGGLMSYGPNFPDLFRRAAEYVDKILRGAKPADIPVEQPTKFDLVFNLTTAKVLGLKVPEAFLLRADEVIE